MRGWNPPSERKPSTGEAVSGAPVPLRWGLTVPVQVLDGNGWRVDGYVGAAPAASAVSLRSSSSATSVLPSRISPRLHHVHRLVQAERGGLDLLVGLGARRDRREAGRPEQVHDLVAEAGRRPEDEQGLEGAGAEADLLLELAGARPPPASRPGRAGRRAAPTRGRPRRSGTAGRGRRGRRRAPAARPPSRAGARPRARRGCPPARRPRPRRGRGPCRRGRAGAPGRGRRTGSSLMAADDSSAPRFRRARRPGGVRGPPRGPGAGVLRRRAARPSPGG